MITDRPCESLSEYQTRREWEKRLDWLQQFGRELQKSPHLWRSRPSDDVLRCWYAEGLTIGDAYGRICEGGEA